MLELENISASYGKVRALERVSLSVAHGQVVCLLGANGAGKTTTLNCISGVVPLSGGRIRFEGEIVSGLSIDRIVARGIVQVPEGRAILTTMTVLENLELGAYRRGLKNVDSDLEYVFNLFPRLKERITGIAGNLSGGEQQMLAIGRALMAKPRLLLLDEPSMGLAPMVISQIFKIIAEINSQGTTVLLVEQNAQQALSRSDRAYILETGEVTREGKARELLADDSIRAAYLGVA